MVGGWGGMETRFRPRCTQRTQDLIKILILSQCIRAGAELVSLTSSDGKSLYISGVVRITGISIVSLPNRSVRVSVGLLPKEEHSINGSRIKSLREC